MTGTDATDATDATTRTCDACGEAVKAAALKCRFCGTWFDPAQERARRRALTPPSAAPPRLRAAAALTLVALPSYLWCSFTHVCMAGHFDHPPYPWWEFVNEAVWTSPLVVAAALSLSSGGPVRGAALGALVAARWVIGDITPLDLALMLGLVIGAVVTLARGRR